MTGGHTVSTAPRGRIPSAAGAPDREEESFYDPELDEGCAFEELICFHGGLGGVQTRRFILYPSHLELPPGTILGAASVHGILAGWRKKLHGGPVGAVPAHAEPTPAAGVAVQSVAPSE
jgi:hypothetical protein